MRRKFIIYENQRLHLESMLCLLERNAFSEKFHILTIQSLKDLEKNIKDESSVLLFNTSGMNSAEVPEYIEKLLTISSDLKIIIHTPQSEARMIKKYFDKGVKGYLGKNATCCELLDAINQVKDGKVYVNDAAKIDLFNFVCNIEKKDKGCTIAEDLTTRELDVLHLICDGLRAKEIAEKLFISTHTVESHRRNIMMKLNINTSNRLVKFAFENRLVDY